MAERRLPTRSVRRADVETTTYLGMPLVVRERAVEVQTPDGRVVGTAYSMSGARRIVRGYRRAA